MRKNDSSKISIEAEIEKIEYQPTLVEKLKQVSLDDFKSGRAFSNARFVVEYEPLKTIAISQWKSPKRTRTYPYARVYDTLSYPVRLTIIPFVKDEGWAGDLDFLQWDTVSLMSLTQHNRIITFDLQDYTIAICHAAPFIRVIYARHFFRKRAIINYYAVALCAGAPSWSSATNNTNAKPRAPRRGAVESNLFFRFMNSICRI